MHFGTFARREAAPARRRSLGAGTLAALLLLLAVAGCQTVHEETVVEYSAEDDSSSAPRDPQPDDPLPPIGNVQVISGDTLRMTGGKTLKLHGIRAPEPGEPYYLTARRWLQSLVGHQVVRFTYKAGTRYTDPVWHVNLLVPNRDRQRGGAHSANALMLANGLAHAHEIDSLRFASVGDDGKLEPLSQEQNEGIRELFRHSATEARTDRVGLHSGVREP